MPASRAVQDRTVIAKVNASSRRVPGWHRPRPAPTDVHLRPAVSQVDRVKAWVCMSAPPGAVLCASSKRPKSVEDRAALNASRILRRGSSPRHWLRHLRVEGFRSSVWPCSRQADPPRGSRCAIPRPVRAIGPAMDASPGLGITVECGTDLASSCWKRAVGAAATSACKLPLPTAATLSRSRAANAAGGPRHPPVLRRPMQPLGIEGSRSRLRASGRMIYRALQRCLGLVGPVVEALLRPELRRACSNKGGKRLAAIECCSAALGRWGRPRGSRASVQLA